MVDVDTTTGTTATEDDGQAQARTDRRDTVARSTTTTVTDRVATVDQAAAAVTAARRALDEVAARSEAEQRHAADTRADQLTRWATDDHDTDHALALDHGPTAGPDVATFDAQAESMSTHTVVDSKDYRSRNPTR